MDKDRMRRIVKNMISDAKPSNGNQTMPATIEDVNNAVDAIARALYWLINELDK